MAVRGNTEVFWHVTPCSLADRYHTFGATCCLRLHVTPKQTRRYQLLPKYKYKHPQKFLCMILLRPSVKTGNPLAQAQSELHL